MTVNHYLGGREPLDPNEHRAPFSVEFTRDGDEGDYAASLNFGGINPWRALSLLNHAAEAMLEEIERQHPDRIQHAPPLIPLIELVHGHFKHMHLIVDPIADWAES